jgi:DNA-binding protein HU-beta
MNQSELIDAIAKNGPNNNTSKTNVKAVLDELAKVTQAELKKGGEVTLPGLGKLSVKESAARKGRNPASGAEIDIPAKRSPKFASAKALKDAVAY